MKTIFSLVLYSLDGGALDEPVVFLGVSGMDCVNQAKQYMVDTHEVGLNEETSENRTAFDQAGTYDEFSYWLRKFYAYYHSLLNVVTIDESAPSRAVKMLPA